ncbi:MAG: SDR family NAD(P)-dependent oxidoreductase [Pseudomonadota bacterium]|nr:SDR family NAD(P)-dependent oxidoreductase [Pseudomonadota bacterium]
MKDRLALITGASRGIGAAVAKRFAREGAHCILAARDVKGLEETDDAIRSIGAAATLVPLDLRDPSKIENLAEQVAQRFGRLDILVGNAGMLGELTPLPHLDPALWNEVMTVNLTANFYLIRCFDVLLKRSDAGRAMFVTSGVTQGALAYYGAYAASKAALEMMVNIYAAENRQAYPHLKINLIDPGEVRTQMHAQALPGLDPMQFPAPEEITDVFVRLASVDCRETGKKFHAG